MSLIDVKPLYLKDVGLRIAADDYEKHVSGVSFIPTTASATFVGLGGNTHTASGRATWVCNLDYVQDWETDDSLSKYLHEHEGETVEVVFLPSDGSDTFTADITIVAGQIGGAGGAFATSTVSCGSTRPVVTPIP
jgi:hypothetical protein